MNFPLVFPKDKVTKYGHAKPYFKFYLHKKVVRLYPEIPIHEKYWTGEGVSVKYEFAETINTRLNDMRRFLKGTLLAQPTISGVELKKQFNIKFKSQGVEAFSEKNFYDYFYAYLEANNSLTHVVKKQYKARLDKLKSYNKYFTWKDLTYSGIKKFENFLLGYQYKKAGEMVKLKRAGIKNYLKTLRLFSNVALNEELISNDPFKKFDWGPYSKEEKQAQKRRSYLRPKEIEAILNLKGLDSGLQRVHDYMIIAIHTGLAVKDMRLLEDSMIVDYEYEGENGLAIYKDREKTKEPLFIPLFLINDGLAQRTIKKYVGKGGRYFDLTEDYLRKKIRVLCAMAGIKKNIGTHGLRHTCATWLLHNEVKVQVVQRILGHADIKSTIIYMHISEESVNKGLKTAWKKD